MIVVSAGMPRSGTGWVYQLTNELLVASGQPSSEQIRKRFSHKNIDDVLWTNRLLD